MQTSKFLDLLQALLKDCGDMCLTETSRDFLEIERRVQHEGLSFLTITLPNFAKDFEKALEQGFMSTDLFCGWRKRQHLPEFLRGFVCQCFDVKTGGIVNGLECYKPIRAVRQVCYLYKKVNLDCAPQRVFQAFEKYKRTERDLHEVTPASIPADLLDSYRYCSRAIIGRLFHERICGEDLTPHHGPGSTADRILGNKKFEPSYSWPRRLEKVGLGQDRAYSSEECYYQSSDCGPLIEESDELPVRVITVPKTLKTPRIIAMEPCAMQMAQQGVKDFIVEKLETHHWTKGHINFKDQSKNRSLALDNSKSRQLATLDLEEASDRVPTWLVSDLFEANRDLQELVLSCRTRVASLPDGCIKLVKYASMGSALCFPVEALHFFVLLLVSGLKHRALPITAENIYKLTRQYYVYGDDIICPVDEVNTITDVFQKFGSIVSRTKSFSKGFFRESCGMDAYNGFDVTPIYVRKTIPNRMDEAPEIISSVSTANQLSLKGYVRASMQIRNWIESLTGTLPIVDAESGGLGWQFGVAEGCKFRYNRRYQRHEVLTYVVRVHFKSDAIDGYAALAKCLYRLEQKPNIDDFPWETWEDKIIKKATLTDSRHLERSPRPNRTITLKRGWITCGITA